MKFRISLAFVCVLALVSIASAEPTTRLSGPIPTEAGHFKLRYYTTVQDKPLDLCVVFSNSKKIAQTPGKIPVLIYLCGVGERGTNGDLIFVNGPAAEMQRWPELNDSMPMMVVSPQVGWDRAWGGPGPGMGMEATVVNLVDILAKDPRVDPDRIYLTGTSMGGRGTFLIAAATPKSFAAISPMAPAIVPPAQVVPLIKDLPIWQIVGENNANITKGAVAMDAALKAAGADEIFSELPGIDHHCWPLIYPKHEFYDWLLAHKRGQPATQKFDSDEMMKIAMRPVDDPITKSVEKDFVTFDQYWQIINCSREGKPGLRAEANGRKNVFVATALNSEVPCVVMTGSAIAKGKTAKLNFSVGCDPGTEWVLAVFGDGKELLNQKINQTTTKDGWLDSTVDLSDWTGKYIHLYALIYQSGDKPAPAYFSKLSLDVQ